MGTSTSRIYPPEPSTKEMGSSHIQDGQLPEKMDNYQERWTAAESNEDGCGGQTPTTTPMSPVKGGHEFPGRGFGRPGRTTSLKHNTTPTQFFLHREMTLRRSFLVNFFSPETLNATLDPPQNTHVQHATNRSRQVERQGVQFSATLAGTGSTSHAQH